MWNLLGFYVDDTGAYATDDPFERFDHLGLRLGRATDWSDERIVDRQSWVAVVVHALQRCQDQLAVDPHQAYSKRRCRTSVRLVRAAS